MPLQTGMVRRYSGNNVEVHLGPHLARGAGRYTSPWVSAAVLIVSVFAYVGTVNVHESDSESTCAFTLGSNLNVCIERALRVDYHSVKRRGFIFDRH